MHVYCCALWLFYPFSIGAMCWLGVHYSKLLAFRPDLEDIGFPALGYGLLARGCVLWVLLFGPWTLGFGYSASGSSLRVLGLRLEALDFWILALGLGLGDLGSGILALGFGH